MTARLLRRGRLLFKAERWIVGIVGANDKFEVELHDSDVLVEIQIATDLMIAASEADGPMSQRTIDEVLGIDHDTTRKGRPAASGGR
ncbi:MAG: hypothetical protein ACRDOJ_13445 [Nocardioidaceae bacterium]